MTIRLHTHKCDKTAIKSSISKDAVSAPFVEGEKIRSISTENK